MRVALGLVAAVALAGCLTPGPTLASTEIEWSGEVTYPFCSPDGGSCRGGESALHVPRYDGNATDVQVTLFPDNAQSNPAEIRLEVGAVRSCGADCRNFSTIQARQGDGHVEVAVDDLDLDAGERVAVRVVPPFEPTQSGQERSFDVVGFLHAWVDDA